MPKGKNDWVERFCDFLMTGKGPSFVLQMYTRVPLIGFNRPNSAALKRL
jgi:hypothetical protein